MGTADISDMKIRPELGQDETVLCSVSGQSNRFGGKAVMSVTSDRIIVGEKKGKSLADSLVEMDESNSTKDSTGQNFDIQLDNIRALRRSGWASKELEVEVDGSVIQLPTFDSKSSQKAVDKITDASNLKKSEWDEKQRDKDTSKAARGIASSIPGIVGMAGGITGALFGILFILIGLLFCLTIIGAIIGAPLIWVGLLILSASGYITAGGGALSLGILAENREEEWIRTREGSV